MSTSPLSLHAAPAAGFDQPFEMLGACHERVRRSLALLQRLMEHLERHGADAAARGAAADVLRYFDIAAPAHHEDEERHVLPVLRACGDAALAALAERLHDDHRRMAEAWSAARPGLQTLAEGAPWSAEARAHFEAWRGFAGLYAGHLEAEDRIAFPAAVARTPAVATAAMGREMALRRGVPAGTPAGPRPSKEEH